MIADQTETIPQDALVANKAATLRLRTPLQKIFSFPVVLGALLLVVTMFTVRSRFSDPDTWWHLKTGEIIWNTHHIPTVDLFSYTTNHHAYTPHEWLSQLTIYAAYHFGGYTGMMLWLCIFASLFTIAGYALCWLYSGNCKVAFLGGLGIWFFATIGFSIRPQLIGYLLLICELLIIQLGRTRNVKWFLLFPPLFALWVNCHASFSLGIIVLAVVLLCSFVNCRFGLLVSDRSGRQQRNTLAAAFALSIAALFVNPVGLQQLTYPINTMFSQHIGLKYSSEWQPSSFDDVRTWALLGAAGLVLLVPLLRRVELTIQEVLLTSLGFALAIEHERMLYIYGILAMPPLCRLLATAWENYEPGRDSVLLNAFMLALAVIPIPLSFPSAHYMAQQVKQGNPVRAVEFVKHSGLSGRMLNEYVYGGYLIWAAPEHKVFVDGRADVFEWTGVLDDYIKWATLQDDPRSLLRKYRIDFCLLSRRSPTWRIMQLMPGWKMVYSDDMSAVFVRVGTPGVSATHK